MITVTDSGSMVTDKKFNVDVDLQITQMESTVSGQGPYKLLMDYKGHVAMPCGDGSPEELTKDVKLEVSGVLGLNGASVDLYSYSNEQGNGTFTLEGDDSCLPVSFAQESPGLTTIGSHLDLKTTADLEKLKIPEHCDTEISRRSIAVMVHAAHLKEAMKRGFSWIDSAFNPQKRVSPWIELQNNRKRGFLWPWLSEQ